MSRLFSKLEIFIGVSILFLILLSVVLWQFSSKNWEDIAVNALSDIIWTLITIVIIQRIINNHYKDVSRGKRRLLARNVQMLFQDMNELLVKFIRDGIVNSGYSEFPSRAEVGNRMTSLGFPAPPVSSLKPGVSEIAAFFLTYYSGRTDPQVVSVTGARYTSSAYLHGIASQFENRENQIMIYSDKFLPDEILDGIDAIRGTSLFQLHRQFGGVPFKNSDWMAEQVSVFIRSNDAMCRYFVGEMGNVHESYSSMLMSRMESDLIQMREC